MTHPGGSNQSEFGDFENDFNKAPKAEPGISSGDLIPEGVYKGVCSHQDLKGDGVLVDHEVFTANSGTKGFKLFLEILEPETVADEKTGEQVKTKGMVQERVFWVTQKNMAYLKRDIATILGRDLKSLSELTKIPWAGLTCEFGIKHALRNGFKNSEVSFINAWKPSEQQPKKEEAPAQSGQAQPAATPDF